MNQVDFRKESLSLNKKTAVAEVEAAAEAETNDVNHSRVIDIQDNYENKWKTMKKVPFVTFCILVMVWTLMLTSFESVAAGMVISIPQFRKHFGYLQPDGTYVIEAKWQSIFSGVPLASQIIGQFSSGLLSDAFGKKRVLFTVVLTSTAFIGMEFAANGVGLFIGGKVLNGFCLGIIQPAAISYVSDIAPLPLRGSAITLCNTSFTVAPLICYIINYSLSGRPDDDHWVYKALFASQWGFAVVSLFLLLWIYESPTYYIVKGNLKKAEICYNKLLKNPFHAKQQLQIMTKTVDEANFISKNTSVLDLFKSLNLKRTVISVVPLLICPNSGVFLTGSYITYYFQLSNYDASQSFRFTCGAQIISLGGCIASFYLVDLIGRRKGMIVGLSILLIFDLIIGGAGVPIDNPSAVKTTVAFMMLYGGVYNALIGALAYPICAENPTSSLRVKTISLGLCLSYICNMLWSFVLPYLFNPDRANLGAKTMFIFGGLSVISLIYLLLFQTETKGRSYDEVDKLYASKVPLRKFKGYDLIRGENYENQE